MGLLDASLGDVFAGVATFLITAILYMIYHVVKARSHTIDVLDLNVHVLVLVLGQLLPGFRTSWNKYAALYKLKLIEEDDNGILPADQADFEKRFQDTLRGPKP